MKKDKVRVLVVAWVVLIVILVVFRDRITTANAIEIVIAAVLVSVTVIYVFKTAEIARANEEMAAEMKESRDAVFRPILSIEENMTNKDMIQIGLDGEKGDFPPDRPCRISNIGAGPALAVEYQILVPTSDNEFRKCRVSVIGAGITHDDIPSKSWKLKLEDINGYRDQKVIRVRYKDIFGNEFESTRQIWLDGGNHIIDPLQINPISKVREKRNND